jgi:hypothetical protein
MPKPNRITFTQLAIERLQPPATGRVTHWDRHLPGFGLRHRQDWTWVRSQMPMRRINILLGECG